MKGKGDGRWSVMDGKGEGREREANGRVDGGGWWQVLGG
jgi:hypothetical protein